MFFRQEGIRSRLKYRKATPRSDIPGPEVTFLQRFNYAYAQKLSFPSKEAFQQVATNPHSVIGNIAVAILINKSAD